MLSRQSSRKSTPMTTIFQSFEDNHELTKVVNLWESGKIDAMFINQYPAEGTVQGGPNAGKPVFQYKTEPFKDLVDGGLKVSESKNCVSFIPGGYRNAPTVNTINPYREIIGGESSLQSLIHVITIPKSIRIYNAATLHKEHIPLLEEMKSLGNDAIQKLLSADKNSIGSLQWVLNQSGTIGVCGKPINLRVEASDMLSGKDPRTIDYSNPTIHNSFHVYPTASVGWLHLHTYLDEFLTTAYQTMETHARQKGYKKNTPYEEVIEQLSSLK